MAALVFLISAVLVTVVYIIYDKLKQK
jgi:hypothetical protein